MAIIKEDERLDCKTFDSVKELLEWANNHKKMIDIVSISLGTVTMSPFFIMWFKVRAPDKKNAAARGAKE